MTKSFFEKFLEIMIDVPIQERIEKLLLLIDEDC
jgi:hypothetical protein